MVDGKLLEELRANAPAVIIPHRKPDCDALATSLAVWHVLRGLGVVAWVVSPTDFAEFLMWLPGAEEVVCWDRDRARAEKLICGARTLIFVDFNELGRLEEMAGIVRDNLSGRLTVLIDHHLGQNLSVRYAFWEPDAPASALMAYRMIVGLEEQVGVSLLTPEVATCLYAGIIADTGDFRFSSTTAEVLRTAAHLVERGASPHYIASQLYDTFTVRRLHLFGYALLYCLRVLPAFRTAYILLDRETLRRFNGQTGDTEGLVNYTLSLRGVVLGATIADRTRPDLPASQPPLIRLSFRSKGDFPANELARRFFGGGGHLNAAGATFRGTLREAEERFLEALYYYADRLRKEETSS